MGLDAVDMYRYAQQQNQDAYSRKAFFRFFFWKLLTMRDENHEMLEVYAFMETKSSITLEELRR